ncbi:hypothetical protein MHYP_G00100190 [Metynnis hypsauchen]
MSLIVSLLVLLSICGVVAQDGWAVNYYSKSICALKGSELTLSCSYTYPSGLTVKRAFWTKEWGQGSEPPDVLNDPEYRGRVQYLGNHFSVCTLKLRDVREKDQSKYYFRFITRGSRGKYQGEGGVDLSVTDGPKTVSVSISPSGEIVEGSSVTLTCSSDANPPVEYNWFKGTSLVAKEETYTMEKISSVDSGEYKCRSSNEHGYKYSAALSLNVLYPPKNISVSISPSGETAEGSSVNLTCSSDANPPVQSYTWFKEGGSSPVGSGHSYRALQSGFYYCVAQNEHGSQKSAAENLYSNVAVRSATSDAAPDPDPSNQDDVHYASVEPLRVRNPRNAESSAGTASAFGADEEVHYASVKHHHDKVVETTEGDDVQYASAYLTFGKQVQEDLVLGYFLDTLLLEELACCSTVQETTCQEATLPEPSTLRRSAITFML